MRLFYFARIDIATRDASSRHVTEFCRHLARQGHELTLFLPDMGTRTAVEGVKSVYIPVGLRNPAFTFFSFYFVLLFYFLYHYLKNRPDVVYTRHQQMEWLVTWLRIPLNFTYVIEVNGLSTVEQKMLGSPAWVILATRRLERILFRMADKMVASSGQIQEILCREYRLKKDHFVVVTNGADPESFRPMDPAVCRGKLGLKTDGTYLLFLGSLRKWHGLEQILLAMPELTRRCPQAHLMIVGEGRERQRVEQIIRDHALETSVTLFGEKPFEDVPEYINAADICLGSFSDKPGISPLKIFDYMACGKPIVSNAVGGMDALIRETGSGLLVDSQKPEAWIGPIATLIGDPQRRQTCGSNGRQAVVQRYNWDSICKKIADALEEVRSR